MGEPSAIVSASTSTANARDRYALRDANGNLEALITRYAAANNVPESLVRRVIHRESRGNPRAVSKGNYGLMQIRLGTARQMGYRGNVRGLLDAETNMRYAVKYLAGAWRVAGGNADRAVRHYAAGYYYAAKRKGLLDRSKADPIAAIGDRSMRVTVRCVCDTNPKSLPDGQSPRRFRVAGRKVRSPQGSVPANGRGAALKGRFTESATENIPPRFAGVRVKWCGKSAPRLE